MRFDIAIVLVLFFWALGVLALYMHHSREIQDSLTAQVDSLTLITKQIPIKDTVSLRKEEGITYIQGTTLEGHTIFIEQYIVNKKQ